MISTETTSFPLWYQKFDNSKRHCFPDKEGILRLESYFPQHARCKKHDHTNKEAGKVEWMRFIHEINPEPIELGSPKLLNFPGAAMLAPGFAGNVMYCESYRDHTFRIFINTVDAWVLIECDDEKLYPILDEAYERVKASYGR